MKTRSIATILISLALDILAFGQGQGNALPNAPAPTAGGTEATYSSSAATNSFASALDEDPPSASIKKSRNPSIAAWTERHSLDVALAGSFGFDMFWTHRNMTHPLHVTFNTCNGPVSDVTAAQCFADPNHTIGTSNSGIDPRFFSEGGWTKIFGGRNFPATLAGQAVADGLLDYAYHRLSKKGRLRRRIGEGLLIWKTQGHIVGGYGNITAISWVEHMFILKGAWNVHWY